MFVLYHFSQKWQKWNHWNWLSLWRILFSRWFSRLPEIRSLHIPPSHLWVLCQMFVKPGPGASMICHINLWRSSLDETKLHHFHRWPWWDIFGLSPPRCQELDPPVTGFLKIRDCCNGKKVLQHVINKTFVAQPLVIFRLMFITTAFFRGRLTVLVWIWWNPTLT